MTLKTVLCAVVLPHFGQARSSLTGVNRLYPIESVGAVPAGWRVAVGVRVEVFR